MARDFIIKIEPNELTGSVNGNIVQVPFIRHVNSVPSLKQDSEAYTSYNGGKKV